MNNLFWSTADGGLRDGGLSISEEKGRFPPFSGFPRCCSGPPEDGDRQQKAKEARKGGQTPLNPLLSRSHLRQPKFRRHP